VSSEAPLHPDVAHLAFLLGTWEGEGRGDYPTIEPFPYGEAVSFWHNGKPFLSYSQLTWHLDDHRPLHSEMGFLRGHGKGEQVEWVIAHPSGIVEIEVGWVKERNLELESKRVTLAPTAKQVTRLTRSIEVVPDMRGAVLRYQLSMAAVGQALQQHLSAELRRLSPEAAAAKDR